MKITGTASVVIQAPAETIYDYLLDFTKHSEWNANISKVWQVSEGPIGVGARFHARESAPPVSLIRQLKSMAFFMAGLVTGTRPFSEAEITALEPDRRIAWVGRLARRQGDFNRAEWEIVLEPQPGGTLLTQRFQYFPQTAAARGMVAAIGGSRGIENACAVNLGLLKARLEQPIPQPA
jgi:uncharacterized protein YndB with AHSA1/START domain